MTNASGPLAPYMQVVADIRGQIERGELKPGDRLPSHRALADQHGIALMTAAKAVRNLCEEGWAVSTPSLGVFVAERNSSGAVTMESLSQQLDAVQAAVVGLAERVEHLEQSAEYQ